MNENSAVQPPRTLVFLCEGGSDHWIALFPGAGQRVTNYLNEKLGLEAFEKNVLAGPKKRLNELKFNLIAVAPGKEYTREDIIGTLRYPHSQGARFVHVVGHSLGDFALLNFMDAEIAALIDSSFWASSGPGNIARAAPFIGKAKFANWIAVSKYDTGTAGDLGKVSRDLHNSIIGQGGNSFLQVYGKTTINTKYFDHPILDYVLLNPNVWPSDKKPLMDPYQWSLSNAQGFPIVSPETVYIGPVKEEAEEGGGPIIEPPPPPPAAKITIVWPETEISMGKATTGEMVPLMKWTDGSDVDFSLPGEKMNYINMKKYTLPRTPQGSVKYDSGKSKVIGPFK